MALSISGSIQNTALPDVLEGLGVMKASGALEVSQGDVRKTLYLQDGKLVFASSNEIQDRLGEVLVKAGMLQRTHLEQALEISQRTGGFKKLGAILSENGFIAPKDLFTGLKLQVKEIIYSVLLWQDGNYQFQPELPSDLIPLQMNLQELLKEFVDRMRAGM